MQFLTKLTALLCFLFAFNSSVVIGNEKVVCPQSYAWDGVKCSLVISEKSSEKIKLFESASSQAFTKILATILFGIAMFNIVTQNFKLVAVCFSMAILYASFDSFFGDFEVNKGDAKYWLGAILLAAVAIPWLVTAIFGDRRYDYLGSHSEESSSVQNVRNLETLSREIENQNSIPHYLGASPTVLEQPSEDAVTAEVRPKDEVSRSLSGGKRKVFLD